MAKTLIIVEFKEEVEFLLKEHPEIFNGETKVFSLLPEASEALIRHGIPFETSMDYFTRSSHEEDQPDISGLG
jgi:hypothetical protein